MASSERSQIAFLHDHSVAVTGQLDGPQIRMSLFSAGETVVLPRHRHDPAHLLFLARGKMSCSCHEPPYPRWIGVFHPPGSEHECELRGAHGVVVELGPR